MDSCLDHGGKKDDGTHKIRMNKPTPISLPEYDSAKTWPRRAPLMRQIVLSPNLCSPEECFLALAFR